MRRGEVADLQVRALWGTQKYEKGALLGIFGDLLGIPEPFLTLEPQNEPLWSSFGCLLVSSDPPLPPKTNNNT